MSPAVSLRFITTNRITKKGWEGCRKWTSEGPWYWKYLYWAMFMLCSHSQGVIMLHVYIYNKAQHLSMTRYATDHMFLVTLLPPPLNWESGWKPGLWQNVKCKIGVLLFLVHIQYLKSPKCLDGFGLDHNCAYRTTKSFYFKRNRPRYTLKRYLCRRRLSKINKEQIQECLDRVCFNLGMRKIILNWA